jgi:hypothetical protein
MPDNEWTPCPKPAAGDIIRWDEPLWAAPNKPRGKPDKIGEQRITAKVAATGELLTLEVIEAEKLAGGDAALKVKAGDSIRRRQSTITQGACHRRAG